MAEIIISIASKLAEYLVDPTINGARYLFCVSKITKDLATQKKELLITQESVQKRVEEALGKTHEIEDAVKKWLDEVKDLVINVEKQQQELMANKGCFRGRCLTIERYRLSKQLAKKTKAMTQLNSSTGQLNPFSHPAPIPDIEHFSSKNFMSFKSTELAFVGILEALQDDNCYMIGLYGMGGSGKTTLVKELGKKVKEEKLFDHVAFTTVSQTPNLRKIQGEIADLLGVKFEEESEAGRARRIALKLRSKKRILIILDDVWAVLNLEDIGISCDDNENNCKVILTTRDKQVCTLMICQRKIPLGLLSEDETWSLFRHHANVNDMTYEAREICKECKGLPIAVVAVGRCLKGKGIDEMNVALDKLRHSKPIDVKEGEKDAFSCLRLSYDYLKSEEDKLLFLMCAMFPEDHNISREDIFRYGKGLSLCSEVDSFNIARSQVNAHINNLIDSCLLTHSEEGNDYFEMHDMVRDVALWIGSKQDHTISVNPTEDLIALPEDELKKDMQEVCMWYRQIDHRPDASKFKILVPNLEDELDLSLVSFEDIQGQKVVALKSICVLDKLSMIKSTQWLAGLQTLRLVGLELGDISFVACLRKLEILDLHDSEFNELPDGIKELSKLKLLDLSNCDTKESCRVIERCSKLQELYALSYCQNVEVPWECLNSATFSKLERYHVKVGTLAELYHLGALSSKCLCLGGFNISALGAAIKDLLQRTNQVYFYDLQGGCKNIFPEMDQAVGGMNALSDLIVVECKEIECLVSIASSEASSSGGLHMLIPVCPRSCYLKRLVISGCPKLTTLFPMSVAQTLVHLQELIIFDCKELKHIMINEEEKLFQNDNSSLMFQQLKKLNVSDCNKLECIFPISCSHGFPQLQEINIRQASALKHVFGISNCAFSRGCNLSSLEDIRIVRCPLLTSLFPTSVAQTLLLLKWLYIDDCCEFKQIVVNERGGSLEFPRLEVLQLCHCPNLQYVIPISCIQSLVNLKEIHISGVSGLEYVFGSDDCENRSTNENEIEIVFHRLQEFDLHDAPKVHQIFLKNFHSRLPERRFCLRNCPKLTTVGFNTMAGSEQRRGHFSTPQCARVEIINCGVENIFHVQGIGLDEDQQQLIALKLENLPELRFIWTTPKQIFSLQFLRRLEVKKCAKLKCIFNSAVHISMPLLAELIIFECEELEEIFAGNENFHNSPSGLPKLRKLEVKQCNKLKAIFSASMAMTLSQLEILCISEAAQLEEVVRHESEDITDNQRQVTVAQLEEIKLINLPSLVKVSNMPQYARKVLIINCGVENIFHVQRIGLDKDQQRLIELKLGNLPELRFIWTTAKQIFSLQFLKQLEVKQCTKLKCIFNSAVSMPLLAKLFIYECEELEEIFEGIERFQNPPLGFPKLKILEVKRCNKLKTIMSTSMAMAISQLKHLYISEVAQLEEVVRCESEDITDNQRQVILPQLKVIELDNLPSLVKVWHGLNVREVNPKEIYIFIDKCPKLVPT